MTSHTLRILLYACIFSIVTATASQARDVTLQWDPSTDTTVTGYKLYYNADSATTPFSGTGALQGPSPIDVKNLSSSSITGLDATKSYYFAAILTSSLLLKRLRRRSQSPHRLQIPQ
jgi:chitinase